MADAAIDRSSKWVDFWAFWYGRGLCSTSIYRVRLQSWRVGASSVIKKRQKHMSTQDCIVVSLVGRLRICLLLML
ncbi:hypothetical protein EMIT0P253_350010 [Pseudomonas sp. IT-P253]